MIYRKPSPSRPRGSLIREKGGATTLAAVNPVVVLGPVMGSDFSASVQVVSR